MLELAGMIAVVRDDFPKTSGLVRIGGMWYYAKVYRCGDIIRVDLQPKPEMSGITERGFEDNAEGETNR